MPEMKKECMQEQEGKYVTAFEDFMTANRQSEMKL